MPVAKVRENQAKQKIQLYGYWLGGTARTMRFFGSEASLLLRYCTQFYLYRPNNYNANQSMFFGSTYSIRSATVEVMRPNYFIFIQFRLI